VVHLIDAVPHAHDVIQRTGQCGDEHERDQDEEKGDGRVACGEAAPGEEGEGDERSTPPIDDLEFAQIEKHAEGMKLQFLRGYWISLALHNLAVRISHGTPDASGRPSGAWRGARESQRHGLLGMRFSKCPL